MPYTRFFIIAILFAFQAVAHADGPNLERSVTPQAMIDLAHLGLSSNYTSSDRKQILQKLHDYLKANESAGLKISDPSKFSDVYTSYTILHEYSMVSDQLQDCKSEGGLGGEVLEGIQGYSTRCNYYRHVEVSWKTQKTGEQPEKKSLPAYMYGQFYADVEQVSSRLVFDPDQVSSQGAKAGELALLPKVADVKSKFKLQTEQDARNLTGKMHLRGQMYLDAITTPLENIVKLQKGFGPAPSEAEMKVLVASSCPGCDSKLSTKLFERLKKAANSQKSIQPEKMASEICASLKSNGYHFGSIDAAVTRPENTETLDIKKSGGNYEVVTKASSGVAYTQVYKDPYYGDQVHVTWQGEAKKEELRNSRIIGLKAVAEKINLGSIVLTPALTELSENQPYMTKLDCDNPGSSKNTSSFASAVKQAKDSAQSFLTDLNSKLSQMSSTEDVSDDIALMLEVAPKSASHVLMDYPSMTPWICNAINDVNRKHRISEFKEDAVMWGSTIVGGALLVSGIGAPAGAAVLSFSTITSAAIATSAAGYLYEKALVHESDSRFLYEGAIAQNDTQSLNGSQAEYARFKDLELNAMLTLGMSALDFAQLARVGLKSYKSLSSVNSTIESALKNSKWTSEIKTLSSDQKLLRAQKIFEKPAPPAQDLSYLNHAVQGDFEKVALSKTNAKDTKLVLSGGGHTKESIQKLIDARPDLKGKITFETQKNGVMQARIPRDGLSYDQAKILRRSHKKGFGYYDEVNDLYGKTLFPENWDAVKIDQAIQKIKVGTPESVQGTTKFYRGSYDGIEIQVTVQGDQVSTAFPVWTGN